MGLELDLSEAINVANRIGSAGGRIGARTSAVFRKTVFDIEADAEMLIEAYDAVDTGDLMGSVTSTISGDGRHGRMDGEVGPTVDYGHYVHDGTSVMPGRPYLSDAFDRRYPGYEQALAQVTASELL